MDNRNMNQPETVVEIMVELLKNTFRKLVVQPFVEIRLEISIAILRLRRCWEKKNVSNTRKVTFKLQPSLEERTKITKEKMSNTKVPKKSHLEEPSQKILPPKPFMRPQTGYNVFCSEVRQEVKFEHPKLPAKKITKKLSLKWKNFDLSDKHKFNETANSNKASNDWDMEIYNRAVAKIQQTEILTQEVDTSEDNLKRKSSRQGKIRSILKKPPITGYEVYLELEERDFKIQNPNISAKEIGKKLKSQWKSLDPCLYELCIKIAKANRERYQWEVDGYNNSLDNTDLFLIFEEKANEYRKEYCEYKEELSSLPNSNSKTSLPSSITKSSVCEVTSWGIRTYMILFIVIMLVTSFVTYIILVHQRRKLPEPFQNRDYILPGLRRILAEAQRVV